MGLSDQEKVSPLVIFIELQLLKLALFTSNKPNINEKV
jgi:hypothetical protein